MSKTLSISIFLMICISCVLLGYGVFGITVNNYHNENIDLVEENKSLYLRLDELTEDNNLLQGTIIVKDSEIKLLESQIKNYGSNIQTLLERIRELELSTEDQSKEIERLNGEIDDLNDMIDDNELKISELESEIENLTIELDNANIRIDELINQLNNGNELFQKLVSGEITEITAEDLNGVTEIKPYAFYGCKNLVNVELPESVKKIGTYAFSECTNLVSVAGLENVVEFEPYVFLSCENLDNVKLSNDLSVITSGMFAGSGISSIIIPDNVKTIEDYAFESTNLVEIEIPDSVSYLGERAFSYCFSLESVVLGDNITEIMNGTFFECFNLSNVKLSENLITISNSSFWSCNIEVIEIPSSVKEIQAFAFENCNISEMIIYATIPPVIDSNSFSTDLIICKVPAESVETYKTANIWSTFANKIYPISEEVA